MMSPLLSRVALAAALIAAASPALARSAHECDEAKALRDKAVQHIAAVGPQAAYADFSAKDKGWIVDELYVSVLDQDGKWLAAGGKPHMVGKPLTGIKDKYGAPVFETIVKSVQTATEGVAEYTWPNPDTQKLEHKRTYVAKVGDTIVISGCYLGD